MTSRPLYVTRSYSRDATAAVNSQAFVSVNSLVNILKGQDKFFGPPGKGPVYDYPNPRGYVPSIDLKTWIQFASPGSVIFTAQFREALHANGVVRRVDSVSAVNAQSAMRGFNILSQTVVLPASFGKYDWPNPRGPVGASDNRTWLQGVSLSSKITVSSPFYMSDWPLPRGAQPMIDLRTFLNAVETQLIGADKFFGAPGQVPIYDWQNPRGAVPAIDLKTWTQGVSLSSRVIIIYPTVFGLFDWPVPRGPAQPMENKTFLNAVETQLIGKDQIYGAPGQAPTYDWQNPRGATPGIELRSWMQPTSLAAKTFVLYPSTFGMFDWPVPKAATPSVALRTHVDQVKFNLLGKDQFFGAAGEGPQNLDWTPPKGAIPGIALRTHIHPMRVNLLGQDQFYGAPGQPPQPIVWIVPVSPVPSIALRSWLQAFQNSFVQAPFANLDWQNPRSAPYPVDLRTWVKSQNGVFSLAPFAMADWPNPRGAAFSQDLRTWSQSQVYHLGAFPVSSQHDWPVPKGARPSSLLLTHAEPTKLNLRGQDRFFGAPGQPPANLDWPVPKGKIGSVSLGTWVQGPSIMVTGVFAFWPIYLTAIYDPSE